MKKIELNKALNGLQFALKSTPIVPAIRRSNPSAIKYLPVTDAAEGLYHFVKAVRQRSPLQQALTRWGEGRVDTRFGSLIFKNKAWKEGISFTFTVNMDLYGHRMPDYLELALQFVAADAGFAVRQMTTITNPGLLSESYLSQLAINVHAKFLARLVDVPKSRQPLWRTTIDMLLRLPFKTNAVFLPGYSESEGTRRFTKLFSVERKMERVTKTPCLQMSQAASGDIFVECGPQDKHRNNFEVRMKSPHLELNSAGMREGVRYSPAFVDPMVSAARMWPNYFRLKMR